MDSFIKLKIPCATKSYIKKTNKKLILLANAYYIWDLKKEKIIDEYLEIIKTNFRLTDQRMIKPTVYYKNQVVKKFREKFLNKYQIIVPQEVKEAYKDLTQVQIKEVNQYLKSINTTIRTMYSFFNGSNCSGAEQNDKASPIRAIDNDFFDCNFANPLNKYVHKPKHKNYPNDLKTYSLKEFIDKKIISGFNEIFYKYNPDFLYQDNVNNSLQDDEINKEKEYKIVCENIKFKLKESQKLYIESIVNQTIDNWDEFIKSKKWKTRLRGFFDSNVKDYIRNKYIPYYSSVQKTLVVESAHIISFSKLTNDILNYKNLELSVNPYNCLRISSDHHSAFDKGKIIFDLEGNVLNKQSKKIIQKHYLDINNIPFQTIEILKEYLNNN